ncbi:hypothetical protein [Gallibacterium anatis]|nr:hypothetical protein [Gallibacterium anatis]WKS98088.1 hypothetical protein NYR19_04725 [Gallibacterium anatis]
MQYSLVSLAQLWLSQIVLWQKIAVDQQIGLSQVQSLQGLNQDLWLDG